MKDLFGHEVSVEVVIKKKRKPQARGYAMSPGTGPDGETCKTCRNHLISDYHNKRYHKCGLVIHNRTDTHGLGTDIRVSWAACARWEPII